MRDIIERAWDDRSLLNNSETVKAIEEVIEKIDKGALRVAETADNGEWIVNEWIKSRGTLFPIRKMETMIGPFEFHDKMALKSNYAELGVRSSSTCSCKIRCICCTWCYNDAILCKYWRVC